LEELRLFLFPEGAEMAQPKRVEISVKFVVGLLVLGALGASLFVVFRPNQSKYLVDSPSKSDSFEPQVSQQTSTHVAVEAAVNFNSIDYRDKSDWLARLRTISTARGYALLEDLYVPMTWPLFEKDHRVILPSQVSAIDQGAVAQGPDWQVRGVLVSITGQDDVKGASSFPMQLLLRQEAGSWKFDSLVTDEEVKQLQMDTGGGQ
jgi:hypothetical protein